MLNIGQLAGKTLFITGASRGIGKAIALKAARDGANVVIAAKSAEPHPKLPGTIYTAADEVIQAGGKCLPCVVDVRNESDVQKAVDGAVSEFGGIDIVVNNASAISLTGTAATPMKTYDLMNQINARGTFLCSKLCLEHLQASAKKGNNPHILNISPPLTMRPIWFEKHTAYTMAKFGMSMCVLGMAEEFKPDGIAVNALWPKTAIITAAMEMLGGKDVAAKCRTPEIMADAAYAILIKQPKDLTGQFLIDETVLKEAGVKDMRQYAVDPDQDLILDFFLDENLDDTNLIQADTKKPSGAGSSQVSNIFAAIKSSLNEDVVKGIGGIFQFELTGDGASTWTLDLKNGSGDVKEGASKSDVTMKMSTEDFEKMFTGKLSSTQAFMQGKLNIKGNMGMAMKLETVMKNTKFEKPPVEAAASSGGAPGITSEVINKMKAMMSPELVGKIQATYLFKLKGDPEETWSLNLKSGDGSIEEGSVDGADVTMTMTKELFVDIFNGKTGPTQAFMMGKLDIKGNMGKAMKLDGIIKQVNK